MQHPRLLIDFEGALDSFTGVPLCTKHDVVAINNTGAITILWISKKCSKEKIFRWISEEPRLSNPENVHIMQTRPRNSLLWILQLLRFPIAIEAAEIDYFYCVLFPGIRLRTQYRRVLRIHDPFSKSKGSVMSFLESPARLRLRIAKFLRTDALVSILNQSILVSNSQWTAERFERVYGVDSHSILVINNLVQFTFKDPVVNDQSRSSRPYFIFVGGQRQRKNPLAIIEHWAFDSISEECDFVVVGFIPTEALSKKAMHLFSEGRLRIHQNIHTDLLQDLIQKSLSSVFYSFGEGWGQPLAESLACGRRVICNDLKVFKEIAGNWADYFPTGEPQKAIDLMRSRLRKSKSEIDSSIEIQEYARKYDLEFISRAWSRVFSQS